MISQALMGEELIKNQPVNTESNYGISYRTFAKVDNFRKEIRKTYIEEKIRKIRHQNLTLLTQGCDYQFKEKNKLMFFDILEKHFHQSYQKQQKQLQSHFIYLDFLIGDPLNLKNVSLIKEKNQNILKLLEALFFLLYSCFSNHPDKIKNLVIQNSMQIVNFWIAFLNNNKYCQTAQQKQLHLYLIELLNQISCLVSSKDFNEFVLKWVQGTQALTLIFNSLDGNFLNCRQNERIYDIILLGMKNQKIEVKYDAVDVLLKCIKMSDYDDIYEILSNKSQIFTELIHLITATQIDQRERNEVTNKKIHFLQKAAYCVNLFLSTYDEYILACVKEGAAYIAAKLITEKNSSLIKQGLQIFTLIVGIQDYQYSKEAMTFLLYDNYIQDTGVWNHILNKQLLFCHENVQVRTYAFQFMSTFFLHAKFQQSVQFAYNYRCVNNEDLVQSLIEIFLESQPRTCSPLMKSIVFIFRQLMYLSSKYNNQLSEDKFQENQWDQECQVQINLPAEFQLTYILKALDESNMSKRMNQLCQSESINSDLRDQLETFISQMDNFVQAKRQEEKSESRKSSSSYFDSY